MNIIELYQQTCYKRILEQYLINGYCTKTKSIIRKDFLSRFNCQAIDFFNINKNKVDIRIRTSKKIFIYRLQINNYKYDILYVGVR